MVRWRSPGLRPCLLAGAAWAAAAAAAGSAAEFTCPQPQSGSWLWSSEPAPVLLPSHKVNDGYCDCPHGGDESATGACSGRQMQADFQCANPGHAPQTVPPWAVGDGVCDCCDGSDEASAGVARGCAAEGGSCKVPPNAAWQGPVAGSPCANTCAERKARLDRLEAERRAWLLRALSTRREWVASAAQQLSDKDKAEQTLPAEIAAHAAEEEQHNARVRELEAAEQQRTAELRKAHEQRFLETVAVKDEELVTVLARLALSRQEKSAELLTGKLPHGSEIDDVELLTMAMEPEPNVPEFVSLLRLAEVPIEQLREIFLAVLQEGELYPELSKAAERGNQWSGYLEFGEYPTYKHPEKEAEEGLAKSARERKDQKQVQLDNLKETSGHDFGPDNAFHGIFKQCAKRTIGEHEYEFCPYDKVKQGWREVGKWKGWSDNDRYDTMEYDNGASDNCPDGRSRSAAVHLRCGEENRIVSVVEAEVCAYSLTFETPAACREEDLN